jgi:flavin-dependent dehydrogenase
MAGPVIDVAIVGGGPAGTVLATLLARRGVGVTVLERQPAWQWRAGGVFTSPAAVTALRRIGLADASLEEVARPIPAMRLETPGGAMVRLTYGSEAGRRSAVGFDRAGLDRALEAMAVAAGAVVRRGVSVTAVELTGGPVTTVEPIAGRGPTRLRTTDGDVLARIVVGADGSGSVVATAAGVARPSRLPPRVGLTWHVDDPRPTGPHDARLIVVDGGYVGLAPVPGGRLNIGIVLGPAWRARLASTGARTVASDVLSLVRPTPDDPTAWATADVRDRIAGAAPLGGRVTRRAGPGWFLVGDAAGFLDPFTGEGLHRALASTELAASAIEVALGFEGRPAAGAADAYDRAMRRRFASKDAVSWLVQTFLARPALLEYAARRLAARDDVRATMGLVMGDLVPASLGLDPRFLAALLRP